jgi:hypothetical protein
MTRILLTAIALLALAAPAFSCDQISFSAGSCYSQAFAVQAYAAPVQQYCAPQAYAAPIQSYAPQAQYYAAPARVQIIRPEVRLELSQVQAYAAPQVIQKQFLQAYAAPQLFVQKQLAVKSYDAPVVVKQQVVSPRLFGGGRSVQRSFSRTVIRN